jgi:hypothetical protein
MAEPFELAPVVEPSGLVQAGPVREPWIGQSPPPSRSPPAATHRAPDGAISTTRPGPATWVHHDFH